MKITLQSPIAIYSEPIAVKMHTAIDGHYWDVTGMYDIRTNVFTPQMVESFSIEQFANDSGADLDEMVAKLQSIFSKNRGW